MAAWVRIGERTLPSAEVEDNARRAASALESLGVGANDVIAVVLRNDFPFLEASFGAGLLGAYVTPVNWHNTAKEAGYIFQDSDAKAIVIHSDLLNKMAEGVPAGVPVLVIETPADICETYGISAEAAKLPANAKLYYDFIAPFPPRQDGPQQAPGAMIYTSGTTGQPKGVRRNAPTEEQALVTGQMVANLFGVADVTDYESVTALAAGPLYHSTPNAWGPFFFRMGANVLLHTRFDAERLLADIEKFKVTHLLAVPTMFVRLLKLPEDVRRKYDVSSIKFVMHGAAPCPPEVKRQMIQWWGPVIWEHYGGTETGAVTITNSQDWLAHPGTVGHAMPGARIAVLDEEGNPLPEGGVGEIAVWLSGYPDFTYNKDDAKRRKADRAGLVTIGDVGYLDKDGFLYLAGRASDMVISGGVNIYPAEIEAELLKMPGVMDCAVFGIPDEEYGESLCAFVQPRPEAKITPDEIKVFLRGVLAGYKVPKRIELHGDLPREDSGKIFKRKLRAPFWEAAGRSI